MLYASGNPEGRIGKKDSANIKVPTSSDISKVDVNIQLLDF